MCVVYGFGSVLSPLNTDAYQEGEREPYSTALSALVQSVILHTKPFFVVAKEDAGQRSTFNRNAQKRYTFLNNRKVAVDVQTGVQLVSIQYQEFTLKPSYVEIS